METSSGAIKGDPLLIVGSMAFDDLELPTGQFNDVVGGSATYAAIAASIYTNSQIVAVVGDDFPKATLEDLEERGTDTAGIEHATGKTFRWKGRYSDTLAERWTLDTQLNVFADFRPKLQASHTKTPVVLLGNIHPALQLEVLQQMESPRVVAADTMNFWIEGERDALLKVLARVTTLIINDEELRQLADTHNVRNAARKVLAMGPKRLIVKRGEHGSLLFDDDRIFYTPAYPLENEVDPTGAGDSFAGALLGYIAKAQRDDYRTLQRAMTVASVVASFCVEGVGSEGLKKLDMKTLARRVEELRTLVRVE